MKKNPSKVKDFEQSLTELETIVNKMESGELALEESLATFEKGIKLAHACQTALDQASQKVDLLIEENGLQKTVPFSTEE